MLASERPQGPLPATDSGVRPGAFPLGSAQSRAAARSLVAARKASEENELRFQVVSVVDGARVNLDGLAEKLRAARMNAHGEESPVSVFPVVGHASDWGR